MKTADDIFNKAATDNVDIVIPDTRDEKINHCIPQWCREATAPLDLILLPIRLGKNCIGMVYIENVAAHLPDEIMNYLDTLRKQAAMAVRQKSKP